MGVFLETVQLVVVGASISEGQFARVIACVGEVKNVF